MTAKEQLRKILEALRLSIPQLADATGINKSTFYSIQKELSMSFSPRTASVICNIYKEIDYNKLISGENPIIKNNTLSHDLKYNKPTPNKIKVADQEIQIDDFVEAFVKNKDILWQHPTMKLLKTTIEQEGAIRILVTDRTKA